MMWDLIWVPVALILLLAAAIVAAGIAAMNRLYREFIEEIGGRDGS